MTAILEEPELLEFVPLERRELTCGGCGYGALVRDEPPACPMCHASIWLERDADTFAVA